MATYLEGLLESGELHRLAAEHGTVAGLAKAIGMSPDSFSRKCRRLRAQSVPMPTFPELFAAKIGNGDSVNSNYSETPNGSDFTEEEPTNPSAPIVPPPYVGHVYEPQATVVTHRWSELDVPAGSVIGVLSDVHIPHHDEHALRLAVECLEDAGVTHVILNGDIADCGPASRHPGKKARAVLDEGDLRESVSVGSWLYKWARSKRCTYTFGNHEGWVVDTIKASPELRGTAATELMGLPADGDGWRVLPPLARVRLGSRCWEHLDGFFKTGNGGANPGARVKSLAPHQTTSGGHLHRRGSSFWTSEDEFGISRTFGVYFNGHLSLPSSHTEYMGSYMSWQQSFEITRVYYVDGRPRFTTDQPEIHRSKQGRPVFEYNGKVYGR